jgi:NTP pyrophosphatase (non-canonical NTP hydrolase)
MHLDEYQKLADRTAKKGVTIFNLVHAQLGMTTEIGEFATEVKRVAIYEKPLTTEMREHMMEELGDLMWYVALAATALDCDLSHVANMNIDKLKKRFPDKYSNEAAEARADKGGLSARAS